jgi:U4/U6.U5 tri-snRNP component SNU23
MSDAKKSASNDVSFRRTWDRDEYAQKAAAREAQERADGKARAEARAAGKKWFAPRPDRDDEVQRESSARAERLDVASMVGKTQIVPAGAAQGRRGRGAGFYCAACDMTFKDNLQLVEHYNSRQHQMAVGETGEVRRAGAAEVRARLTQIKRKMEEEREVEVVDLSERLRVAAEREEREREEKRRKRNERRRKTKDGVGVQPVTFEDDGVIR